MPAYGNPQRVLMVIALLFRNLLYHLECFCLTVKFPISLFSLPILFLSISSSLCQTHLFSWPGLSLVYSFSPFLLCSYFLDQLNPRIFFFIHPVSPSTLNPNPCSGSIIPCLAPPRPSHLSLSCGLVELISAYTWVLLTGSQPYTFLSL